MKQGLTSQQIAEAIFLSKHTIDKYRKNLLEKTACVNSPQLLAYLENLNVL
jgi:DNA-binding CsgD family transcriptional regulator